MDPVSQGLVGAVFPQSISNKKELGKATLIGLLSGIAADVDVLIRSDKDPLLFIDYHRQFTHSLLFIPLGGFIMAVIFWLIFKKKMKFGKVYLYSTLGYATHPLLDSCTAYGTELLWPFSNTKIAWSNIAVIDPVFTIVLAVFVIFAFFRKSRTIARIGVIFCISYLLLGLYQQKTAENYLLNIAALRGHTAEKILVHPTLGNIILWRGIYLSDGDFYVDGIRLTPFSDPILYKGGSIKKLDIDNHYRGLDKNSVLYNDILRFNHFASGYLVMDGKNSIGDIRYSALPNSTDPLWAIEVDTKNKNEHVKYSSKFDNSGGKFSTFLNMLRGREIDTGE